MYGRSNTSNSRAPSGPNLASEGASICTEPNCSASISSPSLKSELLGYTSTLTRPLVRSSASCLKRSAPLPLGVSSATTWLNLMTIGCCAAAGAIASASAAQASASALAIRVTFMERLLASEAAPESFERDAWLAGFESDGTALRRNVNSPRAAAYCAWSNRRGCQARNRPGSPGAACHSAATPMPGTATSSASHHTSGSACRSHGGMPASCRIAFSARRGRLRASCRRSPPARRRTRRLPAAMRLAARAGPALAAGASDRRAVTAVRARRRPSTRRRTAPGGGACTKSAAAMHAELGAVVRDARPARRRARASSWRQHRRAGVRSKADAGRAGAGTSAAGCARDAAAAPAARRAPARCRRTRRLASCAARSSARRSASAWCRGGAREGRARLRKSR